MLVPIQERVPAANVAGRAGADEVPCANLLRGLGGVTRCIDGRSEGSGPGDEGRGDVGDELHARLADDIDAWATDTTAPYAHAYWLP